MRLLKKKFAALKEQLCALDEQGLLICFSGGTDSSFLAAAAVDAGCQPTLLSFALPIVSRRDIAEAALMGRELNLPHQFMELDCMHIPQIAENMQDRFSSAKKLAAELGLTHVADGCNADDIAPQVYRPGLQAAEELGILHPLADAGFTKAEIREQSLALGLTNYSRPAAPCLASRFPYGTHLRAEKLQQVADGENALRQMGFNDLRIRVHDDLARLEIDPLQEELALEKREQIISELRRLGYEYICLDLEGLKNGSYDRKILEQNKE